MEDASKSDGVLEDPIDLDDGDVCLGGGAVRDETRGSCATEGRDREGVVRWRAKSSEREDALLCDGEMRERIGLESEKRGREDRFSSFEKGFNPR